MFFRKTFIEKLVKRSVEINSKSEKKIVFPETDEVILRACSIIKKKKIATPIIIGKNSELKELFKKYKINNLSDANIFDHLKDENLLKEYSTNFVNLRKQHGKELKIEEALELMKKPHFFGGMMVHKDQASGMICGINSETKPYLPAFQIIGLRDGITKASGLMIIEKSDKLYFFADIALNINPTSEELSQIALTSADTVINFGVKPKIAMLSFSTNGSAKHEMVDKVKNATLIVKKSNPDLLIDGEIQFDAATVPSVAKKKFPSSVLQGQANTFIFPDLNSGNISYKITQRLAGFDAVGPIMQGLNKPVNDLSRGASVDDVVKLTALTVVQSLQN